MSTWYIKEIENNILVWSRDKIEAHLKPAGLPEHPVHASRSLGGHELPPIQEETGTRLTMKFGRVKVVLTVEGDETGGAA